MKKFNDMTQGEINTMSQEDFENVSPFEKRSCYDCAHLKSAMSLWCTNKDAIEARGTSLPGCIKCTFWQPNWKYIDSKYRTEENGYIEPVKD
jgi:hypothetical protein